MKKNSLLLAVLLFTISIVGAAFTTKVNERSKFTILHEWVNNPTIPKDCPARDCQQNGTVSCTNFYTDAGCNNLSLSPERYTP